MPGGSIASSTLAQPAAASGKASVLTRASASVSELFFTEASVSDPSALYRVLHAIWSQLARALRVLSGNPVVSGNLLTGWVFTAGQTQYLPHGLARAYQGWVIVRAQSAPPVFVEAALPAGVSATQMVGLTSTNAGTYSILVF